MRFGVNSSNPELPVLIAEVELELATAKLGVVELVSIAEDRASVCELVWTSVHARARCKSRDKYDVIHAGYTTLALGIDAFLLWLRLWGLPHA